MSVDDSDRFESLLPFYLTGNLTDSDARFVQTYLSSNPQARDRLDFTRHIQSTVRSLAQAQDLDSHCAQFMQRWGHQQQGDASTVGISPSSEGNSRQPWHQRMFGLLALACLAAFLFVVAAPSQAPRSHSFAQTGLDGKPDLEVVLPAETAYPSEPLLVKLLEFEAVVVQSKLVGDRLHLHIDLNQRSQSHALAFTLTGLGLAEAFFLLAL